MYRSEELFVVFNIKTKKMDFVHPKIYFHSTDLFCDQFIDFENGKNFSKFYSVQSHLNFNYPVITVHNVIRFG